MSRGTALVTGGGARIGEAIALALGRADYAVAVHYHTGQAAAETAVATIESEGGRAVALAADLTDEGETAALIGSAETTLGPISVLINNAALFEADDVATATRASWDRHMAVNLRAPFVLMQEFAKALGANRQGTIVNIIDERVWNLTPYFVSYTVSKTGLWTLTQTMALALAPNIRVNAIGPGPTLPSPRQTPEQFAAQCRSMPLGRGTSPGEIAAAVLFILDAPAMTGQMIALDGGQHLGWAPSAQQAPPPE